MSKKTKTLPVCPDCNEVMFPRQGFVVRNHRLYSGYWVCSTCGRVSVAEE